MRRTIAILTLIFGFGLPVQAAECATANIEWVGTSPKTVDRHDAVGVRFALVGHFVNYQIDDGDLLSSEFVPNEALGYTVCADGVTFDLSEEPVERDPDPGQLIVDVDVETWLGFQTSGRYPF